MLKQELRNCKETTGFTRVGYNGQNYAEIKAECEKLEKISKKLKADKKKKRYEKLKRQIKKRYAFLKSEGDSSLELPSPELSNDFSESKSDGAEEKMTLDEYYDKSRP